MNTTSLCLGYCNSVQVDRGPVFLYVTYSLLTSSASRPSFYVPFVDLYHMHVDSFYLIYSRGQANSTKLVVADWL